MVSNTDQNCIPRMCCKLHKKRAVMIRRKISHKQIQTQANYYKTRDIAAKNVQHTAASQPARRMSSHPQSVEGEVSVVSSPMQPINSIRRVQQASTQIVRRTNHIYIRIKELKAKAIGTRA